MPFLYIAAAAALFGLLPMPYFGYTLVRIGVTVACLIAMSIMPRKMLWGISSNIWLVAIAVLYNPIAPIFLNRELWIVIDLVVALILFFIATASVGPDDDIDTHEVRSNENYSATSIKNEASKLHTNASISANKIARDIEEKGDRFSSNMIVYGLVLLVMFGLITVLMK